MKEFTVMSYHTDEKLYLIEYKDVDEYTEPCELCGERDYIIDTIMLYSYDIKEQCLFLDNLYKVVLSYDMINYKNPIKTTIGLANEYLDNEVLIVWVEQKQRELKEFQKEIDYLKDSLIEVRNDRC